MKKPLKLAAFTLVVSALSTSFSTCFAGGSLNPPGAPGVTMKSLDEAEPRTTIAFAPFTINSAGSYFLSNNLSVGSGNAIVISNNDVTLDLKGFTISCTNPAATGYGIFIKGGARNVTILNGFVQGAVTNGGGGSYGGAGFSYGISYDTSNSPPANVVVSHVSVANCQNYGINLGIGDSTVVESCTVRTIGNNGIVASTVNSSSAADCGNTGISGDQASNCRGQSTGFGTGVSAGVAMNCFGTSVSGPGVSAAFSAQNCYGNSGSGDGVSSESALNCNGQSSSGSGIHATSAENCYGLSTGGCGVLATTAQNCYGNTSTNDGIHANATAIGCYGISSGAGYDGVYAGVIANGCFGYSSGNSGTGIGTMTAQNCYGESVTYHGIDVKVAMGCYGVSHGTGGDGLRSIGTAMTSYGYNTTTGPGLVTYIGNSCVGQNSSGTSESVSYQYNMP